jgi:hypothetical protein
MDFQLSVVFDKTQFAEFVHEKAHPRSGRADHLRQGFLTERSYDRYSNSNRLPPLPACTKLRTRGQSGRKSSPAESSYPVRGQLIMAMAMQHSIHPPSSLAGENV